MHFLLLFSVVLKVEHEQMEQPSEEDIKARISDVLNPFNLVTIPTVSRAPRWASGLTHFEENEKLQQPESKADLDSYTVPKVPFVSLF